MLSTASCNGIYNSPYGQMVPATAYGMPIEDHLRNVAKGTLRDTIIRQGTARGGIPQWQGDTEEGLRTEYAGSAPGQLYAYSTKPMKISRSE
mmetsp:Transcript_911/g.1536  ORF Transcript_911/g.1536 Transcript_911/m.1536 type:complete len:92 (+) Transcript_911:105-380(+)